MEINNTIKINRYPKSSDNSLQAWNSADELILDYIQSRHLKKEKIIIYHDRFGYLSNHLNALSPQIVVNFKSQEKSILYNLKKNNLLIDINNFINPLYSIKNSVSTVLIKIPKSVDLFELYLHQLIPSLEEGAEVICGFMTKYFSNQVLKVASKYFEEVEQTKARKKARLLLLRKPIAFTRKNLIHEIQLSEQESIKQYFGVFSASKIDIATQLLIEKLTIKPKHQNILDLGCGNGVLAFKARQLNKSARIHLTDDNYLAIESAKINLGSSPSHHFYFTNDLSDFEDEQLDLVISNPPFHFEYENNIEITLALFKEVARILKTGGSFQLVANSHLNYKTHLSKHFNQIIEYKDNQRFTVFNCLK